MKNALYIIILHGWTNFTFRYKIMFRMLFVLCPSVHLQPELISFLIKNEEVNQEEYGKNERNKTLFDYHPRKGRMAVVSPH